MLAPADLGRGDAGERADRLGQRRREPDRDAAGQRARRHCSGSAPDAGDDLGRLHGDRHHLGAGRRHHRRDDAVPRHRRPPGARGRAAGRRPLQRREQLRRSPAVTLRDFGGAGGQAAAFTYDLARSVVYTRQGNPAWAGRGPGRHLARPLQRPVLRRPDWVDFDKVRVPQADEQQRLLANLIIQMNLDRTPLPRFWYLPHGENAAVVMTGDDHGQRRGTTDHFNRFRSRDPADCSVADWQCVRATSYVYSDTSIPGAAGLPERRASRSRCTSTRAARTSRPASIASTGTRSWPSSARTIPGSPRRGRTGRTASSGATGRARRRRRAPTASGSTRTTTTGPATWFGRPARPVHRLGLPAAVRRPPDGSLIDVYQATTQLTDESGTRPSSRSRRTSGR